MADLPESFLASMREILGEDYERFLDGFSGERQYGLRVNTAKVDLEEFERIAPFPLKKIPWIREGYFYEREDAPAQHPFYSAGLYYLQEPSAMTSASRLPVRPGERVLDLCAAPGGKATALGATLKGEGLLVANDINAARAKALLRNLELFGIKNSFVTNEPPHVLAEHFPEFFHKIMVDAPCSGEGMFRKNPAVVDAWLEKGPEHFARLQREIIVHAADMLLPGGMLFYSTCTFSPLENEGTITHLLRERPQMEVIPMEDYEGFSPGLTHFMGEEFHESCTLCRRIWPHKMAGEGHFLALLKKKGEEPEAGGALTELADGEELGIVSEKGRKTAKNKKRAGKRTQKENVRQGSGVWWERHPALNKEQKAAAAEFFTHVRLDFSPERMDVRGENLYALPAAHYEGRGIHFLRNGLFVGTFKKKRFEPSQPFALALRAEDFDAVIDLPAGDERAARYLRGETLDVGDLLGADRKRKGWQLVVADGYPLGFGKLAGGLLKNKYPASWRRTQ